MNEKHNCVIFFFLVRIFFGNMKKEVRQMKGIYKIKIQRVKIVIE